MTSVLDGDDSWPDTGDGKVPPDERARAVFEAEVALAGAAAAARIQAALAEAKAVADAERAAAKAADDRDIALQTADYDADLANFAAFSSTLSQLAVGSVERSRASADLVQKSAAAVATLYTGVLALVFSVTDHPLPLRGLLAPLFLGLAVVLSTAFLAYLGPSAGATSVPRQATTTIARAYRRLHTLIEVTNGLATRRVRLLRASVLALGLGLAAIVLPFVNFSAVSSAAPKPLEQVTPAWPAPSVAGDPELAKILYDAQVEEVAAARAANRQAEPVQDNDGWVFWLGLVAGVVVISVVPQLRRRPASDVAEGTGPAPPGGRQPTGRPTAGG